MPRRFCTMIAMLAFVITPAALARNDKGKHKGNPHAQAQYSREWQRNGDYEYRRYDGRNERPPGWNRGNKTGWRDCGMPPGQAKKYGCYTYVNEGRRHYYYEDDRGYVYERRPVIEIHGSVDVVR